MVKFNTTESLNDLSGKVIIVTGAKYAFTFRRAHSESAESLRESLHHSAQELGIPP